MILVLGLFRGDGLLGESLADAQTAEPPNFVVVMTDDLDERSMQQLGGIQHVMGSNGTTFKNAYVTYSFAAPVEPPSCGVSTPTTTA